MNLVIALGVIIFNTGDFLFIYPPVAEQVLTVFCAVSNQDVCEATYLVLQAYNDIESSVIRGVK